MTQAPDQQASRSRDSLYLRAEDLSYQVAFLHQQASGSYRAVVSTVAQAGAVAAPHWLEFVLGGQTFRLSRWQERSPSSTTYAKSSLFNCVGVMAPKCERRAATEERLQWSVLMPEALCEGLAVAREVRVTLAVKDAAIHSELEAQQTEQLREFFTATRDGSAYRKE